MTPAVCDICHRSFWATPDSVVDLYLLEEWDNPPTPTQEPDDYVFVCPDCDRKFVFED